MSEINLKLKTYDELTFEISRLNTDKYLLEQKLQQKENIIKEVREYIENNSLYEEDYDYDYEENLVVGPPNDETARKILLEILDKGSDKGCMNS
ncbi:MAG: hypothetical protein IKE89_02285 [Bacilli bacterium]|nr:hypothetical protein [Bacilli bacterium]